MNNGRKCCLSCALIPTLTKGYDSDPLIKAVTAKGIKAVIPPKKNRRAQRQYDQHLYRERHLIECFINKLKHYRRVFSRFEKLSKNYLGFLSFVSALVWLRSNVNRT
jgi:transposase